jgi:FPC/CPF motif-containing protein YcgG
VTALRLHRELYTASAVRGAVEVFARYATITTEDTGDYCVVTVTAKTPERALKVARELGNYALGLTRQGDPLR